MDRRAVRTAASPHLLYGSSCGGGCMRLVQVFRLPLHGDRLRGRQLHLARRAPDSARLGQTEPDSAQTRPRLGQTSPDSDTRYRLGIVHASSSVFIAPDVYASCAQVFRHPLHGDRGHYSSSGRRRGCIGWGAHSVGPRRRTAPLFRRSELLGSEEESRRLCRPAVVEPHGGLRPPRWRSGQPVPGEWGCLRLLCWLLWPRHAHAVQRRDVVYQPM